MHISVKKITHFGMIYNEVLLTRQTPSGNANRHIFCAAGNNKKIISKTVALRAKLWYLCLLPRRELIPWPRNAPTARAISRLTLTPQIRRKLPSERYLSRKKRLPRSLTHTSKCIFTAKKHRKPKFSMLFGAAGRIRTADLILTKDALYLLSYSSIYGDQEGARTLDLQRDRLAF